MKKKAKKSSSVGKKIIKRLKEFADDLAKNPEKISQKYRVRRVVRRMKGLR